MVQYSEDAFYDNEEPRENDFSHIPGVWQTEVVSKRRLAKLLSAKFNKYQRKGYNFDRIYRKLRDYEIQIKTGFPSDPTNLNRELKQERIDAIEEKYDFRKHSYFAAGLTNDLCEYFYKILKERSYTQAQINAIATQLGIQLNFEDYLYWHELNQ